MIPDSTEITREQGTIKWRNDDFMISFEEAKAIGEEINGLLGQPGVEGVLVDNREADGTWPSEVNDYWPELMGEMYERGVDCVTVSPSMTNALQINRLASDAGMDDRIKAFEADDYRDALDFLGIDE